MDPLAETVYRTIGEEALLVPGEEITVGFSGGADSTVLLHLLVRIRDTLHTGWRIRAAHFNHRLRPESDAEEEFCRVTAAGLGVEFAAGSADVRARARGDGLCIEEAARLCRYAFFESLGRKAVLAHHRDDQVETVLFNVARGTGIRGLAGMRYRAAVGGVEVVRPLLGVGREELRAYAARHGLRFVEDRSNRETVFARNLVRHELLPLLERVHPGAGENVLRLSAWAAEVLEWLDRSVCGLKERAALAGADGEEVYDLAVLRRTAAVERRMLFLEVLGRRGGRASAAVVGEVERLAGGKARGTRCIDAGGGVRVCRRYDLLVFTRAGACGAGRGGAPPVPVRIPGRTEVPGLGVVVDAEETAWTPGLFDLLRRNADPWTAYFDARVFAERPVVVRTCRPGDRFRPLGAAGSRKLQDFFTDMRVVRCMRGRVPLLESGGVIAWVVGLQVAEHARVTGDTARVVKMHARVLQGGDPSLQRGKNKKKGGGGGDLPALLPGAAGHGGEARKKRGREDGVSL